MKQGKVWGWTSPVVENEFVRIHRLFVAPGARCSKHKHKHRVNGFYCIDGHITIRVWKDYGLVDETHLAAGEFTSVSPGEYHEFEAHEPTSLLEFYWPASLSASDIKRANQGSAANFLDLENPPIG